MQYGIAMSSEFRWIIMGDAAFIGLMALYERISGKAIPLSLYAGVVFLCALWVVIRKGFDEWKHGLPQLRIPDHLHSQPMENSWVGYYFDLINESSANTVEEISVTLETIEPKVVEWLPLRLSIKHGGPHPFSLNPQARKQIDIVTAQRGSATIQIWGLILEGYPVGFPAGKYRLRVMASGKNVTPATAVFETWMNESGELRCIML
jgi:hypothetical protein